MLPHPLTNFEIQKYFQTEPKFNGIYSSKHLTKIRGETYVINLDEYKSIRTHWIALRLSGDNVTLKLWSSIYSKINHKEQS